VVRIRATRLHLRLLTASLLLTAALPLSPASAQRRAVNELFPPRFSTPGSSIPPGAAMLASAILPGAGQKLLEEDRWVPYAAVEVWAWLTFRDQHADGRRLKNRYRDLAWEVARRVSIGARRDSTFPYYELMSKHEASGAFDVDPRTNGVQPELNVTTVNGEVWVRARDLFFPSGIEQPSGSPPYEKALAYYEQNAIPPSYAWAWGDNQLEQRVFAEVIHQSDEAFRTSTHILGVILANHVASAIDALIASRLRAAHIEPNRLQIENGFDSPERLLRWHAAVRITLPAR
jgi:hypothetical protein